MRWGDERGQVSARRLSHQATQREGDTTHLSDPKGTPDSARGGSPESEAERGALPPLRSPFQDLTQHAPSRGGRKSSVRAVFLRSTPQMLHVSKRSKYGARGGPACGADVEHAPQKNAT